MTILQEAAKILTYLAFRHELDLNPLFGYLPNVEWIVPRIDGRRLVLHPYCRDNLTRHPYGMQEPLAGGPVVDPKELDVVLVPGVAFDQRGGRLGFGGGFYDRLLIRTSALRVGIAYDRCLVDELPCHKHDQRMDWLVTPTQAIRCGPLWRQNDSRVGTSRLRD
jgi:5-formyltetrahydrofolate cyclo-ligase